MKVGGVLRETVVASTALAAVVLLVASTTGNLALGLGLSAGLVIGSFNGHLVVGTLQTGAPFVAASVVRMAFVSGIAILGALLLGLAPWSVLIGIGAAQLVLVGAGVRQGMRA